MFSRFALLRWLLVLAALGIPVASAEQEVFIGFAQDTLGNDWRVAQVEEVRRELARYPHVRFEVTDGQGNTALQAKHIEDLVRKGIDLLITSPREQAVLSAVIEKVHDQGVPVVLLDRGIQGDGYTTFIHPENRPIARAAANYLVEALDGKGHILMLIGVPGATPTIHRTEGFLEIARAYPDIRVTQRVANFLRADSILALEGLLGEGVMFDAIYAQSDSMASGARMALRLHGIDPGSIPIVGIDYISEAQEAIRKGEQSASYTYPTGGLEGARAALRILGGERVAREIILDSVEVTGKNVDLVAPIF